MSQKVLGWEISHDSIADSVLCVIQIVRAIQVFKCQRAQGLKRNKHFWGDTRDDTASGNCPHTKCYFVYFWQRPSKTIQTLLTQEMTLYTSSAAAAWEEVLESLEEWLKCQEADSYLVLSVSNKVLNSLALLLVCLSYKWVWCITCLILVISSTISRAEKPCV